MDLDSLPYIPCNNRTPRTQPVDLLVVHTNEGPEGGTQAENLAHWLQGQKDGYNVIVDENSAVRTAPDMACVWGAGGVNSRAWHICLIGYAAQSSPQWHDSASTAECRIAADLVKQAAAKFHVPIIRTTDSRSPNRGICGHVDVSRYYPASMGHTDPGPNFPWPEFIAAVGGYGQSGDDSMTEAQVTLMFAVLNDLKDRVGWVESAVMPGGHDQRSPLTAEAMRADIRAIKTKTGA